MKSTFLKTQAKSNALYYEILKRVYEKGEQVSILIVGKRRTGKSTLSGRIGYDLDYDWHYGEPKAVCERMTSNPDEFLTRIEQASTTGTVIVLEEAGVNISHREWMSKTNIIIQKTLQVFGFKRIITIFNVPTLKYVDASIRMLFDYIIETRPGADKRRGVVVCRPREVIYAMALDKILFKKLRTRINGEIYTIDTMAFPFMPKAFYEEYRQYSEGEAGFKSEMISKWHGRIEGAKKPAVDGVPDRAENLTADRNLGKNPVVDDVPRELYQMTPKEQEWFKEIVKNIQTFKRKNFPFDALREVSVRAAFGLSPQDTKIFIVRAEKKLREMGILQIDAPSM